MSFGVALRKELMEQWRSYRLLLVAVVLVLMGLLSPLVAKLMHEILGLLPEGERIMQIMPEPTIVDAVGQYTKNLTQFGVLLALLLGMGAVVQEKERGTAALMLAKPISRGVFLAAKVAALGLTFAVSTALAGAAGYYYTTLLFSAPRLGGWLAMNGLLILFFWVYMAMTIFCSTISRSQLMAGLLAFGGMLVLSGLGVVPVIGWYMPSRLVAWGTYLALGMGGEAWRALGVSFAIIVLSLLAAWAVFQRQEL